MKNPFCRSFQENDLHVSQRAQIHVADGELLCNRSERERRPLIAVAQGLMR